MNNNDIVYLEISSFEGISIGATHYYGKLINNTERIELAKKITKSNIDSFKCDYYNIGDYTERFLNEEEVIKNAKKNWKKYFPNAIVLIKGFKSILDPQECIAGDNKWKKIINSYFKLSEACGGYEYNNELMTKISNEYMKNVLGFKIKD